MKARREMSWIGVRELGYSGADVARYLGVTNFCVTRMISTGGKQDIDDINLELLTFGTNVPYYVNQLSAILPVSFNSFVGLVLTPLYPETGFKPH